MTQVTNSPANQVPTLVVGYDFSEHSMLALDHAIRYAARSQRTKVVVVWAGGAQVEQRPAETEDTASARALARLEQLVRVRFDLFERGGMRFPGVEIVVRVAGMPAADRLREIAYLEGADILLVGSGGKGSIKSVLMGSVSRSLVADCPCTVMVCRDRRDRNEPQIEPPPPAGHDSTLGRRHTYHYESKVGQPGTNMPLLYPTS